MVTPSRDTRQTLRRPRVNRRVLSTLPVRGSSDIDVDELEYQYCQCGRLSCVKSFGECDDNEDHFDDYGDEEMMSDGADDNDQHVDNERYPRRNGRYNVRGNNGRR